MSQLIDDNRFIWILSSEDEMVCHTLSNLLHSLFEERSKQLKEFVTTKTNFFNNRLYFFIIELSLFDFKHILVVTV